MGIKEEVNELKRRYGTRDPFLLCEKLGIWFYVVPLGNTMGHYTYAKRKKVFFINEDLNRVEKYFSCAHELGHVILHGKSNVYFNSTKTYLVQNKFENQADLFAAELLLDDSLLHDYDGYNLETISHCTGVDIKYLELKFNKQNPMSICEP